MNKRKEKKIRPAQRQKFSMRLILAAGISAAVITIVFVIYFQFFQNDIVKAKNTEILTQENLPATLNVEFKAVVNSDTLIRNGNRYKTALPLSQTPMLPVE